MNIFRKINQSGDTVIEVMMAMSILAVVLTVSFVAANRSLSDGTQAANRRQALQYAEEQVELIRVAANASDASQPGSNYSDYTLNSQPFCIRTTGPNAGKKVAANSGLVCSSIPSANFHAGITYSDQTFHVSVLWENPNFKNPDQVMLYYRAK